MYVLLKLAALTLCAWAAAFFLMCWLKTFPYRASDASTNNHQLNKERL